jgi:hypothetical protein
MGGSICFSISSPTPLESGSHKEMRSNGRQYVQLDCQLFSDGELHEWHHIVDLATIEKTKETILKALPDAVFFVSVGKNVKR